MKFFLKKNLINIFSMKEEEEKKILIFSFGEYIFIHRKIEFYSKWKFFSIFVIFFLADF